MSLAHSNITRPGIWNEQRTKTNRCTSGFSSRKPNWRKRSYHHQSHWTLPSISHFTKFQFRLRSQTITQRDGDRARSIARRSSISRSFRSILSPRFARSGTQFLKSMLLSCINHHLHTLHWLDLNFVGLKIQSRVENLANVARSGPVRRPKVEVVACLWWWWWWSIHLFNSMYFCFEFFAELFCSTVLLLPGYEFWGGG